MDSTNAIPSEVNKKVILTLIRAELGYLNLMKLFFLCVGFGFFFASISFTSFQKEVISEKHICLRFFIQYYFYILVIHTIHNGIKKKKSLLNFLCFFSLITSTYVNKNINTNTVQACKALTAFSSILWQETTF